MEQQENSKANAHKNKLWLARKHLYDGVTYKKLGEEVGLSGGRVAQIVKPIERILILKGIENLNKLEASITTPSDDLKYVMDRRVTLQETCALLMGGDEIKDVLNQLANI
jgi:hypothetical protein